MKGSEFLSFVSQVKQIFIVSESLKQEEYKEDFDWLFKAPSVDIPGHIYNSAFASLDARLIKMESEWEVIESWFPGKKIKLDRLFRGSEDGFLSTAYHAKCDNQSPILNMIESEHGRRFGGYTSVKFDSSSKWFKDENAFIFSLTENKNFK